MMSKKADLTLETIIIIVILIIFVGVVAFFAIYNYMPGVTGYVKANILPFGKK